MYSPPPSSKKQTIKQAAIYILMTLSVITVVYILILIMLGYRFDRAAGTLEQGGLVQLNSIPSGASLTIDAARLSATTSTKATLSPGQHAITMARDGYGTWQKTVDVKGGTILWLNYARLIPLNLSPSNIAALPGIISSMPSPNREWYAMTSEKTSPTVRLANTNSDRPEISTLTLPEDSYTKPEDPASENFVLDSWDSSSRHLLLEHRYDGKAEWIVVDIRNAANTKNITALFDVTLTKPQFSQSDDLILFGLINGDIRRIDINAATISAPLVRNVAEFSFYDRTTLIYVTEIDPATKNRSVGYRQDNASKPRAIRSYSDDGSVPLHISMGKYYNETYVGIAYNTTVDILSGPLPKSDSDDPLSLTAVATMSTSDPINFFSSKTDGRFFMAQHGNNYSMYDLELQKATKTSIRSKKPVTGELIWLDGYTIWNGSDGTLRLYEFDGANQNDIMPIVAGQRPGLSPNNRYLYAPTVDKSGVFHLSRVQLIL